MQLDDLLLGVSPEVSEIFYALRDRILQKLPAATEEIDIHARMTAYSLFPGYSGTVFTLLIARKWVTLGIYNGTKLSDPEHLLSGSGKVHGSIRVTNLSLVNSTSLAAILDQVVKIANSRLQGNGKSDV
jgi:hypothetical protein